MSRIYRDEYGIPHIISLNFKDAAYAIAYVHCEDDFYTIQQWLLASRKRSGHIDDWNGPFIDFICDFFEIDKVADHLRNKISKEYFDLISSYCRGVNLYADKHQDQVLKSGLFPICEKDIIVVQHLMEILGLQLDKPYSYISRNKKANLPTKQGSNIIAITKNKSDNGKAKIAINPHQQMEGLFSFYEIHLKIQRENLELFGYVLPCTFIPFMGTNFKIAWGFTANYPEMYNIYQLKVSGIFKKIFSIDANLKKLSSKYYKNYTKLYDKYPIPIFKKIYKTKYGNVLKINGKYLLIKIPLLGHALGSEINYNLVKCAANNEIKQLCFNNRYGYLNLVSIDIEDNIIFVHNSLEQTKDAPLQHYDDIIELESECQLIEKYYDANNLIYVENPGCNYIVSANQSPFKVSAHENVDHTKYKGLLYFNENSRSIRIKNLLESKPKLGLYDLQDILDDTWIMKSVIRNINFNKLFNSSEDKYKQYKHIIAVLKNWDGNADYESEGAALFSLFYHRYKEKFYIASKNPDTIHQPSEEKIIKCLKWVSKFYKPGMKLKDIQFLKRGKCSMPIKGMPDTVNSIRPYFEKGKLYAEEGGAFRLLIELKERKIFACHPFGSSGNLEDKNSTNQMVLFANNQYRKIETFEYYKKEFNCYTL